MIPSFNLCCTCFSNSRVLEIWFCKRKLSQRWWSLGWNRSINICSRYKRLTTTSTDVPKQYLTNFLFPITFAADSPHMEGLTKTDKDVTGITNGIVHIHPFTFLIMLLRLFIMFSLNIYCVESVLVLWLWLHQYRSF
jgi:hypothetical protein